MDRNYRYLFSEGRDQKSFLYFFLAYEVTTLNVQSTLDNSNLQGKSKKGSSYRDLEENSRE